MGFGVGMSVGLCLGLTSGMVCGTASGRDQLSKKLRKLIEQGELNITNKNGHPLTADQAIDQINTHHA